MQRPILFLDDQEVYLEMMETVLKSKGYEVFTYSDPEKAFEAIREKKPALVLCDYRMPLVSGIEFCKKVRESGILKNGYFLIVTGFVEKGHEEDSFHDLPDGWIPKNTDLDEFCTVLANWYKMVPELDIEKKA